MYRWLIYTIAIMFFTLSCKDEETPPSGVVASFQFTPDATDFLKVQFTNFSQNAASLSWNFGDASALSSEENPLHTFAAEGTFTVELTATGSDGVTSKKSEVVTITNPNLELKKLTGTTTKSWKLLRDVSTGVYPFQVGPADRSTVWYALGLGNEVSERPCALNDEWVFNIDESFEYKTNGDVWAEGGVWSGEVGAPGCVSDDASNFVNVDGADISGWNNSVNDFEYDVTEKKLTVFGGFLGLAKVGTDAEFKTPQTSVQYNVIRLVDAAVDTLVVETSLATAGGYWRFVLVHYDNAADEPAIPGAKPVAGYSYSISGKSVTFTNTSSGVGTITYAWDFGDGSSSTDASPVHTYATDGLYSVTLTATNENGNNSSIQSVSISSIVLTEALINGGGTKSWRLKTGASGYGVGPSRGSGEWWPGGNDANLLDRPCIYNDDFTFKTGGIYEYNANIDVFVEGYWASAASGCQNEANVTGGATIWTSGNHTYSFVPATGGNNPKITVAGLGAFIALPKAYNGGEYGAPPTTDAPVTYEVLSYTDDGTTQTMQIAVDISAGSVGGAWWSFILISQ